MHLLRGAVRGQRKVRFHYRRTDGEASHRTVQPLGLTYWGRTWTLVGWCELRDDFRHFRLDCMDHLLEIGESFEPVPGRRLKDFLALVSES
ncbi:MAG: WYL domain-containing protein [Thiohalomonadaceae bacterium]